MMWFWKRKVKKYYYWVSYASFKHSIILGGCEVALSPCKISTYKDIELIREHIKNNVLKSGTDVVVMSYIYMRTEKEPVTKDTV